MATLYLERGCKPPIFRICLRFCVVLKLIDDTWNSNAISFTLQRNLKNMRFYFSNECQSCLFWGFFKDSKMAEIAMALVISLSLITIAITNQVTWLLVDAYFFYKIRYCPAILLLYLPLFFNNPVNPTKDMINVKFGLEFSWFSRYIPDKTIYFRKSPNFILDPRFTMGSLVMACVRPLVHSSISPSLDH